MKRAGLYLLLCVVLCISRATADQPEPAFDIASYNGTRLVLFVFALDEQRLPAALELMNELYAMRRDYNFEIAGLCLDEIDTADLDNFRRQHAIRFPIYRDPNGQTAKQLQMRGRIGFYLYHTTGRIITAKWGMYVRPAELPRVWRGYLCRYLGIPNYPADVPVLGHLPQIPDFSGTTTAGEPLILSTVYRDAPTVLTIFSTTCGNCQAELDTLQQLSANGDLAGRIRVVGISIHDAQATRSFLDKHDYRFPVISDPERKIADRFPSFVGPVPVSYIIDQQGRVHAAHVGFNRQHLPAIYTMHLRKLAGVPNPPLLVKKGYSGVLRCAVCHEQQYYQWQLTGHAHAWQSLVRKNKTADSACVACHVTGYGRRGGYQEKKRHSRSLKNVQCESCHGPGSAACSAATGKPPARTSTADWRRLCLTCHTSKESLNFVFAARFPRVRHTAMPDLTGLDRAARIRLLTEAGSRDDLFTNPAAYTGADSCVACHREQYEHWLATPHATAHTSPAAEAAPPDELFRYHTGVGREGGYPEPGREGVQCEACHGPGERHLETPERAGHGYIVGLGAECTSCVVEQICRTCHGPDYDPDFDFETALEQVRHPAAPSP